MIADLAATWHLFAEAWLAAWLIAPLLALLGIAVVARGQVLLGAAMGQTATAGVALALLAADWTGAAWLAEAAGPVAIAAAVATALAGDLAARQRDGLAGWLFLAGASGAVLFAARSPHGMEEVARLTASTLVGATARDVAVAAIMLLAVVGVLAAAGRQLAALLIDPAFAAAAGVPIRRWRIVLAVAQGIAIGWSLHVAGALYAFGTLVLPALALRPLVREVGTLAIAAPLAALAAAIAGSLAADLGDLPPAPTTVAILAVAVALAHALAPVLRRR